MMGGKIFRLMLATIPAAALALAQSAQASGIGTLTDASYSASVFDNSVGNTYTAPGSYSAGGALGTITASPIASLSAGASGGTSDQVSTVLSATWYWQVTGPDCGGCTIPILVAGNLSISTSPDNVDGGEANGAASMSVNSYGANSVSIGTPDGLVANAASWSGTLHTLTTVDYTPSTLSINAEADVSYGGSASAFADPMISIDPSFATVDPNYLTDYQLLLSDGVGNLTSNIPEPGSVALLAGSWLLLTWRRNRRNA